MSLFKRFTKILFEKESKVPLTKYIESHTMLVQTQLKFLNTMNLVITGGVMWVLDRQDKNIKENTKGIAELKSMILAITPKQ